jgi:DNA repair photolyase
MRGVTAKKFWSHVEPKPAALERVQRDAAREAKAGRTTERVLLSFASDPYPKLDASLGLTRRVLGALREHGIPFSILTKSGRLAERDHDLYGPRDAFGVTLTTMCAERASIIESGAAPPWERSNTLVVAKSRGLYTWVSLEPVIELGEALRVIRDVAEYADHIKIGPHRQVDPRISQQEWVDFTQRAMDLCRANRTTWYIKRALAARCGLIHTAFENTDDRIVDRVSNDTNQPKQQGELW